MSKEKTESSSIVVSVKKEVEGELKTASISYDFGANVEEMIEKFKGDVVFTNARANMKITAQGAMRRYLVAGKSQDEITSLMASWIPGVALERTVDPVALLMGKWGSMTDEEKKEVLAKLKAK